MSEIPEELFSAARMVFELQLRAPTARQNIEAIATALMAERDSERRKQIERDAKIAEKQAADFLSPQYATGQPHSSFSERFACDEIARAIRAQQEPKP